MGMRDVSEPRCNGPRRKFSTSSFARGWAKTTLLRQRNAAAANLFARFDINPAGRYNQRIMNWAHIRFITIMAAILCVAIALMWFTAVPIEHASGQMSHGTIASMVNKVGEALLIAVFLAIGVDRYVKARPVEDVSRDITPYAVSHFFPEQLKGEVQKLRRLRCASGLTWSEWRSRTARIHYCAAGKSISV